MSLGSLLIIASILLIYFSVTNPITYQEYTVEGTTVYRQTEIGIVGLSAGATMFVAGVLRLWDTYYNLIEET